MAAKGSRRMADLTGNGAISELMEKEFQARPFGIVGEWAVPRKPEPPRPIEFDFATRIPAPDWAAEEREQAEREQAEREAEARRTLGLPEDETEQADEGMPSSAPEPIIEAEPEPPERPVIPPPDWQAEQKEPTGQRGRLNRRRYRRARRRQKGAP